MDVDSAAFVAQQVVPVLEARLDRIVKEVVGKFKGGNLTHETVVSLRADWLATTRLLAEIEIKAGGK